MVAIGGGVAFWFGYNYVAPLDIILKKTVNNSIKLYTEKNGHYESMIDSFQHDMQCCGSTGISDWSTSNFNDKSSKKTFGPGSDYSYNVPRSCCKSQSDCDDFSRNINPSNLATKSMGLYKDGCWERLKHKLVSNADYLKILAITLCTVQVLAFLISCCFCGQLSSDKRERVRAKYPNDYPMSDYESGFFFFGLASESKSKAGN